MAQVSKYRYLLNQYPETVQKEQFRIICHISKRTARYLLQSGLVPCVQSGKKTRNYQGGSEYENSFGGVKYRLPYLPSLEEQAATLKLLEPLSGKEAKTYEPVIAAIAGEVFGDGK